LQECFFLLRQNKKETQYEGIGVILTFVTKYFQKWKVACATFAYMKVETPDLQKILLCSIIFFVRICGRKKVMIAHPLDLSFFFD
jgi:hypothetical protein